jgi:methylase of polypeptide subunit release factors
LSSYLVMSLSSNESSHLPILGKALLKKNLNVLELGAGCGIVGITLGACLPTSRILLTDLPEATDIIEHNLGILPNKYAVPTNSST